MWMDDRSYHPYCAKFMGGFILDFLQATGSSPKSMVQNLSNLKSAMEALARVREPGFLHGEH